MKRAPTNSIQTKRRLCLDEEEERSIYEESASKWYPNKAETLFGKGKRTERRWRVRREADAEWSEVLLT